MNKHDLGNRIRELREYNNLTQMEFAEMLNISDTALSKIECGKSYPSIETAATMAEKLHISLGYLVASNKKAERDICVEEIIHQVEMMELYDAQSIFEYIKFYNSRKEAYIDFQNRNK